jgi:hypothetical protein
MTARRSNAMEFAVDWEARCIALIKLALDWKLRRDRLYLDLRLLGAPRPPWWTSECRLRVLRAAAERG